MNFNDIIELVKKELEQISLRYNNYSNYVDKNDLFSEMILHLWQEWKCKKFDNKTKSYIIQSCYFYLRNYLRINEDKYKILSLDDSVNDDGLTVKDTISDNSVPMLDVVEYDMVFQKIVNNGLSRIEKEIYKLIYNEYTVREIGKKLNISHTMVVKHKKNILKKVSKYYDFLLV
ncbi:MAG TPA: hypothetical protein DCP53_02760 [Elusimicrobia bacterium]|nr:MAG: hypothetical protein A2551_01890 [Elusimicrobia bacterium RIFOXYD2_FULL_34_30]HAM38311.1 hypothetical protein [Elusimicrobiota bacterium]